MQNNKRTYFPKENRKISTKVPPLESRVTNHSNLDKLSSSAIKDLKFSETISKWNYEQLAQYLIQNIWGDEDFNKWPSLKCSVLDKVINILFDLSDKQKGVKRDASPETPEDFINRLMKEGKYKEEHSYQDTRIKPNKNVKVPEYDKLSEEMNPDKIQPKAGAICKKCGLQPGFCKCSWSYIKR